MSTELKVLVSPSKAKAFDRCQLYGQLTYVDKWEPLEAGPSLPARLRGNAFARACEVIHNALVNGDTQLLDNVDFQATAVNEALKLFEAQYQYCVTSGIAFKPETDALSRDELRRVIPLYAKHTPLKQWTLTHVEYPYKKYSVRWDLAGKDHQGIYAVGDIKYKSSLESRYEDSTIEEFRWEYQFQQYNAAYRDLLGVGPDVPVYSYLILVVGNSFRIKPVGWLYTPEQQQLWRASADALTETVREITEGTRLPRASATHRDKFGWCPMKKACLEYMLDPGLMTRDYVQLTNLPNSVVTAEIIQESN